MAVEEAHKKGKEFYLMLPYMLREGRMDGMEQAIQELAKKQKDFWCEIWKSWDI